MKPRNNTDIRGKEVNETCRGSGTERETWEGGCGYIMCDF